MIEFYPTDSLEVFSKQDPMTKKDLCSQWKSQEKLSLSSGKVNFSLCGDLFLKAQKLLTEFHGLAFTP